MLYGVPMLKTSAIEHFGSASHVAAALGITRSAVQQWPELIPPLSAARLERLTEGALKFDPDAYDSKYKTARNGADAAA